VYARSISHRPGLLLSTTAPFRFCVSYAVECERIPSIISNLRRDLESQLSAAAGDVFHGSGEERSLAALGAFTESLQVTLR